MPEVIETRVVAKSNEADYFAFPSVCKLAGGDLACVFYLGTGHISPDGKVAMVRSSDEGRTWTEPQVVIDTPLDDRDPSIMHTRAGRVIVSFFVYDCNKEDRATRTSPRVHSAFSDDGGKSFSKPAPVGGGWLWSATSDEIVELADGTLLMPVYGRMPGDKGDRAAIAFSTDHGESWNSAPQATIACDQAGGIYFQEPALVLLPDGSLRCLLRTDKAGLHLYESRSTDGGKTWSKPIDTFLHGQAAGLLYHSSGSVFAAYRSWSQNSRVRGVAGVFTEPGKPWDPAKEFDIALIGGDVAYPSSIELSGGSILCVYYAREHGAIEAAVIRP